MKKKTTKEYTNGEITITWQSENCIHSTNCWKGLSQVFNPRQRPWVNIDAADTQSILAQVKKCPSGALSFYWNEEKKSEDNPEATPTKIEIMDNGPILIHGSAHASYKGNNLKFKNKVTALCRCGNSKNKPFCDGSHKQTEFDS